MIFDRGEDGQARAVRPFDLRRLDRRSCDLAAVLVTSHGEAGIRIINISAGGIGFTADPLLGLKPCEPIMVRQEVLGEVRLILRWGIPPRYGAAFEPPNTTPPGARILFDALGAAEKQAP
jgi:hypothetical protein